MLPCCLVFLGLQYEGLLVWIALPALLGNLLSEKSTLGHSFPSTTQGRGNRLYLG